LKKERATTSDEQRERQLIAEQIERAANEAGRSESASPSTTPPAEEGLKRDENSDKVVLTFSAKPPPPSSLPAIGVKLNPLKPLKANPLKRPNVFKTATSHSGEKGNEKKRSAPTTTTEMLTVEEQERKRRRMDVESVNG
jgi:DNA/RNA-binding protein KIN17